MALLARTTRLLRLISISSLSMSDLVPWLHLSPVLSLCFWLQVLCFSYQLGSITGKCNEAAV
ncbi:unnamed protein product [Arabidopsis halleri]